MWRFYSPHRKFRKKCLLVFTETFGTALSWRSMAEVGGAGEDRTHLPHAESSPSLKERTRAADIKFIYFLYYMRIFESLLLTIIPPVSI